MSVHKAGLLIQQVSGGVGLISLWKTQHLKTGCAVMACETTFHCAQGILPLYRYWYLEILIWTPHWGAKCTLPVHYKANISLVWYTPWRGPKSILSVFELHWMWSLSRSLKHCTSNRVTDFANVRWATDLLKLISIYKPMIASLGLPGVSQSFVL